MNEGCIPAGVDEMEGNGDVGHGDEHEDDDMSDVGDADHAHKICENGRDELIRLERVFPVIFTMLLNAFIVSAEQREVVLRALLICFHNLDLPIVRKECLRIVSLGCWKALSEVRRAQEFEKQPHLQQYWPLVRDSVESGFASHLISHVIESGCRAGFDFLEYCLLQWPTRRYLAVLMDDLGFVVRCQHPNHLAKLLKCASEASSTDDAAEEHFERICKFQMFIHENIPNNPLSTCALTTFTDRESCRKHLQQHLTACELVSKYFGFPCDDLLVGRIAECFALEPADDLSWDDSYPSWLDVCSRQCQHLLPSSLQYLNRDDYLSRHYKYLNSDYLDTLYETVSNSVKRCKPTFDTKAGKVLFDGWSRYAVPVVSSGQVCKITFSPSATQEVISEWRRVKPGDRLYGVRLCMSGESVEIEALQPIIVESVVKEEKPRTSVISTAKDSEPITLHYSTLSSHTDVHLLVRMDLKDNSVELIGSLQAIIADPCMQPMIDAQTFFYGHPMRQDCQSLAHWLQSAEPCLLVDGPANSGKTSMIKDILRGEKGKKTFVMVPTAESADHFIADYALQAASHGDDSALRNDIVRLGHSPSGVVFGKIAHFINQRNSLLQEFNEWIGDDDFAVSCESAIYTIERLAREPGQPRDRLLLFKGQFEKLLPLEYIQSEDKREEYLVRFGCSVVIMTFTYAAIHHHRLFAKCNPDLLIMDDAHLVPEMYTLFSLFTRQSATSPLSAKPRIIIFGDSQSPLTPIGKAPYEPSLFMRLMRINGGPGLKLSTVYNVPLQLVNTFYKHTTVTESSCIIESIVCDSGSARGTRQNVDEAETLVDFFEECEDKSGVLIITCYNSQVDLIMDIMSARGLAPPQVLTIDKSVSVHADTVLVSTVADQMSSFLANRLSIMWTRARRKLYVFHHPDLPLFKC